MRWIYSSFGREIDFFGCKVYERLWYDCWNIYYTWKRSIVLLWGGWRRMNEKEWIELIICYKGAARREGDQSFWCEVLNAICLLKYLLNIY